MVAEKVVVQLVLDTSKYTANAQGAARSTAKIQGAADKTAGSMGKLSQTAGKLGLALGAAFAAKAALDFANSSIKAFSSLNESVNAVEVSFGDAAEGVFALGENSAEQFGLSTRAVNQAAVAMSAFADKIDAADPADAFGNVLQRATDFASVMDIDVEEALILFRSGLAGESEPLRKFGIDVSAATVNLAGLEAGLGGTNGKLDEGEKVQARYLEIMRQTEKTAGDFANTSDGLANSQRILSAKWEEAQAVLGAKLAPFMVDILGIGTDLIPVFLLLVDAFGSFLDILKPGITIIGGVASALGKLSSSANEAEASGGGMGDVFAFIAKSATELLPEIDTSTEAIIHIADAMTATAAPALQVVDTVGLMEARFRRAGEEADFLKGRLPIGALDEFGNVIAEIPPELEKAVSATERYNDFLSATATRAGEVATEAELAAAGIRAIAAAQAEAASPVLRQLRAQEQLVAAQAKQAELKAATGEDKATAEELTGALLDVTEAQVNLNVANEGLTGVFGESRAAFIEAGIVAGNLRTDMLLAAEAIFGFPSSHTFTLHTEGLGGLTIGEAHRLFAGSGGSSGTTDGRRHGGPVGADEPFIVGEAGPELFIPDRAGRIIPNKGFGGGQSITVNVNDSVTTDLAADLSAGLIAAQITQQVEMLRV